MEKLQLTEQEINFFFETFDKCDTLKCGKLEVETVRRMLIDSGLSAGHANQFPSKSLTRKESRGTLPSLYQDEKDSETILPTEKQPSSLTLDKGQGGTEDLPWTSKYEDEECGLLSGDQAKKSSDILASFNIEKLQKVSKSRSAKSDSMPLEKQSSPTDSSSASSDTLTSASSQSSCSVNKEWPDLSQIKSKTLNNGSPWAYHDLNDKDNKVSVSSEAVVSVEKAVMACRSTNLDIDSKREENEQFYFKTYLANQSGSPQFMSADQKLYKNDRHRRWINSLALNPKREAEYLVQFNELFISTDNTKSLVSPSEVTQLFGAQFNLSKSDFEQIWEMADVDRDGFLNKNEFCLASHLARLHAYEGLSFEEAIEASASYISRINLQPEFRVHNDSPQVSPDSAEYPLMFLNRRDQDFSSDNEQMDEGRDIISDHDSCPKFGQYELIGTDIPDSEDRLDLDPNGITQDADPDDSDSPNESVDDHGDAALLPKRKTSAEFPSSKNHPCSPNEWDKYANIITRDCEVSNSRSSSSCSFYESSDSKESPYGSGSTSDSDQYSDDPVSLTSRNSGMRHRAHRSVDPIHLLSITTGRQASALSSLSSMQRRRLLCSLIREAKSLNHTLLRLNNEMQGELKELNDQRVNLSIQLQHLGLHPSSTSTF